MRQRDNAIQVSKENVSREVEVIPRSTDMEVQHHTPFIAVPNLGGRPVSYKPEYADRIVAWFTAGLAEIERSQEIENKIGDVKYVTKPVFPRTLAGFAISIGMGTSCIMDWSAKYPEFGQAMKTAKAIQEQCVVMMTATGAWTPSFGIFMLKNCAGWTDKIDVNLEGQVALHFDVDDSQA